MDMILGYQYHMDKNLYVQKRCEFGLIEVIGRSDLLRCFVFTTRHFVHCAVSNKRSSIVVPSSPPYFTYIGIAPIAYCTNFFPNEDAINWKLFKNLSCSTLNVMYFSALFGMQVLLPFALYIFLHYETTVVSFEVVEYYWEFCFVGFYFCYARGGQDAPKMTSCLTMLRIGFGLLYSAQKLLTMLDFTTLFVYIKIYNIQLHLSIYIPIHEHSQS